MADVATWAGVRDNVELRTTLFPSHGVRSSSFGYRAFRTSPVRAVLGPAMYRVVLQEGAGEDAHT